MKKLRHRIERAAYALRVVTDGVNGKPRTLGASDAESVLRYLSGVGIELVTKTAAERRGFRLKRGARPLARRYFPAPLKRYADLFDLGSQCVDVRRSQERRGSSG